ncbi:hypothetical protein OPV22_012390 [Ensete ventricosum]|uniref:Uncharacterized protein n=1 Tax=Ensete ventricosum TaxID=4639 RepID=A0AAV8PKZ7_ENSVE|nr:hypothetical protein OPV22_012390 [Ensete ventricosum]
MKMVVGRARHFAMTAIFLSSREEFFINLQTAFDYRQSSEDEIGPSTTRIFSPTEAAGKLVCTSTSLPQRRLVMKMLGREQYHGSKCQLHTG